MELWSVKPADITLWVATATTVILAATKTGIFVYRLIQDARRDDSREWHALREKLRDGKPRPKPRRKAINPKGDQDGND